MRYSRLAVVTAAFLVAFGLPAASQNNTNSDTYDQLRLFGDVFEKVRADYVEEVTDQQLVENAINGVLAALDPHSSYMNAKSFDEMQVQTRGESAASASRSPWRTVWSRWCRRSTTRRRPAPASSPATSSSRSTASP
jgi:C-terminal processing protease CtpA/Prc